MRSFFRSIRQAFAEFLVMSRAKSYKFHMLQYPQYSVIETCRSKILKLKRNLAYMPASIWESRSEGEKLASEQARSSHFQSYGCCWKLPRFLRRGCPHQPVTQQCKFIKKHFVIGSLARSLARMAEIRNSSEIITHRACRQRWNSLRCLNPWLKALMGK